MKIGMKEEKGVADKMTSSVWILSMQRAHSTRICSQEARKSTRFLGMGRKKGARIVIGP